MLMKKILICLSALAAVISCKVVDPFVNPTSTQSMVRFCSDMFKDDVDTYLKYFYNAYYIAKFQASDAELKVSKEYDLIRTGMQERNGVCVYDYREYDYRGEDFCAEKGLCVIKLSGWQRELAVLREGENSWLIGSDDGMVLGVTVLEETENGLLLKVIIEGHKTEESTYSALLTADDLRVEFRHKRIAEEVTAIYDGEIEIVFYNDDSLLKTVHMTFCQSELTWNII